MTNITIELDEDLKRKFKLFAVRSGRSMTELLIEYIKSKVR
jgi:predicted transcriptional regulator